jgi:NifU-like protein involved in Fe-S cluster formation
VWKYTEVLMDHFVNPRNVGAIENPDGHSEVGSPQCGDAMNLDIEIDENDRIADIRFRTFGCAGAIASASALTEMAKGLPVEEALKIKNSQIADFLGGMPPEKYHCSVMGQQALKSAVADFREKRGQVADTVDSLLSRFANLEIVKVHPRWVAVRGSSDDAEKFGKMLSEKLGRAIDVKRSGE